MSRCPVPGCLNEIPASGIFCLDHYFQIPRPYTSLILRTKFMCARAQDEAERRHLREQYQAYIQSAIRLLAKGGHHAA